MALLLGASAVYAQTPVITITSGSALAEPASGNTDSTAISFSVAPPYTERTEVSLTVGDASTARTRIPDRDFTFVSGGSTGSFVGIIFPANTAAASATVQLRVFADNLNEGDETIVLSIGGATHTVTITDNAADATAIVLAKSNGTVNEGGTRAADEAEYRITISGGRPAEATFTIPLSMGGDYITSGRAAPYRDLPLPAVTFPTCDSTTAPAAPVTITGTLVNGTFTEGAVTVDSRCIGAGSNVLDIDFGAPPDDAWAAGDATITMTIARPAAANAGAYTITNPSVSYAVTDDDTGATLTAEAAPNPAEGGGVQTALRFNFIKSGARIRNANPLEVDYVVGGLPAGMTVRIAGATADVATPSGAHAERTPASGQRTASLPAGLNALVFQVDAAAADIAADTAVTVTLHGVFEADAGGVASGNAGVTFTAATAGIASSRAVMFTITTPDDDTAPAARLAIARTSPATAAIAEGQSAVYTVSLPAGHGIADPTAVTFDWTVAQWASAETASGRDFAATAADAAGGTCNSGAGDYPDATGVALGADGSATFTVHVCDDAIEEGFDRFRIDVTVTAPSGGAALAPPQWDDVIAESDPSASATGNFTVTWNGGAGPVVVVDEPASGSAAITVAVTYNNAAATALSAATPAVFTFTRQAPQTLAGQAAGFCADSGVPRLCRLSDADFTETHPTVTFTNGEAAGTVKTVVLRVAADDLYEGAEGDRYRIDRSGGGPAIVGGNSVIVVVRDADAPPALSARLLPSGDAFDAALAQTVSFEIVYPARAADSPATGMVRWEGRALAGGAAVPLSGTVDLSAATTAMVAVELLPNQDDFALDRLSVAAATDAVTCAGGAAAARRGDRLVCALAGVSGAFVADEWRATVASRPGNGGAVTSGRGITFTIAVTGAVVRAVTLGITAAVSDLVDADGAALTGNPVTVSAPAGVTIPAAANPRPTFTVTVGEFPQNFGSGRLAVTLTGAPTDGRRMVGPVSFAFTLSPDNFAERQARAAALHTALLPAATRAVVGRQFSAVAARAGRAGRPAFRWNGQSTWAGAAAAHAQSQANARGGSLDAKEWLRDLDFVMPLFAGGDSGGAPGGVAVWGGADHQGFGGEDGGAEWDGDVWSFRLGVDGRVGDALRAGVMASYSDSTSDYSAVNDGQRQRGEYELDVTAVSPYLNWRLDGGSAWASATYGGGEVEVKPDGEAALANDVSMAGVAGGGSWRLRQAGARELRMQVDAFAAQTQVDGVAGGAGVAEDLEIDANRLRVALQLHAPRPLASGARLSRDFDFGARVDGGDGRTGAGMEVGGRWRYHDAARGLTVQAGARALLAHSGDSREWGVGGLVRVAPGADGQGPAVTVRPGYGDDAADSRALWDGGAAHPGALADPVARLAAELGYGVPTAGVGMLTPYGVLRLGDSARDYRLGVRWAADRRLALDLFARRAAAAPAEVFAIEGRLRF